MPAPDTRTASRLDAATAKAEAMLAAAPAADIDLSAMNEIRLRLAANEAKRDHLQPSSRRTELDEMIAADIETLCEGFVKLERAVERRG
jgi:hypothetical protein